MTLHFETKFVRELKSLFPFMNVNFFICDLVTNKWPTKYNELEFKYYLGLIRDEVIKWYYTFSLHGNTAIDLNSSRFAFFSSSR